ncbi:hypothetical protein GL325_13740 [Aeromicrobium sp. 636]|uniref:Uncharacterized protein n=1 Tax=Aeromicrobium senzhongii TaxID=2663859 RepID=A0A8I0EW76_9ACTN|nr:MULTISPECIES: hypothetical protein [Aeromicrobium]MBC9227385.1 hypothetical protein [Aeromicrobium senzhongii]MCQ3999482.1 hypothetical protein [Aeromicrobium sp. 636]MTB88206.1 hypothetical protein [Aeromicrobium senzhongii]QNL94804.1 hypothetical protein H9L21_02270 [Aeromicrobium senzhongii]
MVWPSVVVLGFLAILLVRLKVLEAERRSARVSWVRMILTVLAGVAVWMLAGGLGSLPDSSGSYLGVLLVGIAAIPSMLARRSRTSAPAS